MNIDDIFIHIPQCICLAVAVVSVANVWCLFQIFIWSEQLTDGFECEAHLNGKKREKNSFRLFIGLHVKCIFLEKKNNENNAKSLFSFCSLKLLLSMMLKNGCSQNIFVGSSFDGSFLRFEMYKFCVNIDSFLSSSSSSLLFHENDVLCVYIFFSSRLRLTMLTSNTTWK